MLVDQFVRLLCGLGYHGVCLRAGLLKDRVLIADNLLVLLDLLWNAEAQLHQKLLDLFLIYENLCIGKRLKFTALNIFLNFIDNLLNSCSRQKARY